MGESVSNMTLVFNFAEPKLNIKIMAFDLTIKVKFPWNSVISYI